MRRTNHSCNYLQDIPLTCAKIYFRSILVFFFLLTIGEDFYSQQNFINVPSSDVTPRAKAFFQQQINFNELIESNTTLDFGLGNGFEMGANVFGLNFSNKTKSFLKNDSTSSNPFNPLVLVNGLKQFKLNKLISITTGCQIGLNYDYSRKKKEAYLIYSNVMFDDIWKKGNKFLIGAYYNSLHYGGQGNRLGCWLGTELTLLNRIHILGESILGSNAISYTSLALVYYPQGGLSLTLGMQVPNTLRNSYSIVFELSVIPKNRKKLV